MLSRVPLLILSSTAVLLIGCSGGDETVTETVTVTELENETPAESDRADEPSEDTEDDSAATPVSFGKTGDDGSLEISVVDLSLHDLVAGVGLWAGESIEPRDGAYLATVEVKWTNNGKVSYIPCSTSAIVLVDQEGRNFTGHPEQFLVSGEGCREVQPGFETTGTVLFEVPDDAEIASVALWDETESGDYDGSKSYLSFSGDITDSRKSTR